MNLLSVFQVTREGNSYYKGVILPINRKGFIHTAKKILGGVCDTQLLTPTATAPVAFQIMVNLSHSISTMYAVWDFSTDLTLLGKKYRLHYKYLRLRELQCCILRHEHCKLSQWVLVRLFL